MIYKDTLYFGNLEERGIWKEIVKCIMFVFFVMLTGQGYAIQSTDLLSQNHHMNSIDNFQFIDVEKQEGNNYFVSLNVKEMRLTDALQSLTSQINVGLSYDSEASLNHDITLRAENINFFDVLSQLLEGTEMEYLVSPNKDILVIRSKKEEQIVFQNTVTGTVVDAHSGEALPGVNVVVKGTTIGTSTDLNGHFELIVPSLNETLTFSYVGYYLQEISLNGLNEINLELEIDVTGLDELVVVGYGSMERRDLTGSVSSIDATSLQEVSVTTVEQALLGKISGVQIKPHDGSPGRSPEIVIRGVGSISAGAGPLYVIDGFPVPDLQGINPDNIESINILKDASATAIYGSRGSNGVVIITMKRGRSGTLQYSFDTSFGFQQMSKKPVYMTAYEQAEAAYWGAYNTNLDLGASVVGNPRDWQFPVPQIALDYLEGREQPTESAIYGDNMPDTDWLDLVTRIAPIRNYQLSASGGSESSRFAITGEYLNQDGIVINSSFKRFSLQGNFDAQLSERLTVQVNLNPSYSEKTGGDPSGTGYGTGAISNANAIPAYTPAYAPNGDYFVLNGYEETGNYPNALALGNEIIDEEGGGRFRGNIFTNYSINDYLTFNIMLGGSFSTTKRMFFEPALPALLNANATGREWRNFGYNWINEYTVNYNKSFGEHEIVGLAGFSAEKNQIESNYLSSNAFPNNLIPYLSATDGILNDGTSTLVEWSLVSYLGRINYNYANKYLLTATGRIDGSSRFGSNSRYGLFPSAAFAWRISNEDFLEDVNFLSNLKLRASYGITGNNNIGNYAALATMSNVTYPRGNQPSAGIVEARIFNPDLTWETQNSFNSGIDIGFFRDRLNLTINYFNSINKDLLLNVNIPSITGFSSSLQNIGKVENTGWEFEVSSVNLIGKLGWSTDFNFTASKNKVLALGPEGDPIISNHHRTEIGKPIGMFYGLVMDGIYDTPEELNEGPIYNPGAPNETRVGDIKFKDISGPNGVPDGIIDSYDRVLMGSPHPDFYFGMTNRFTYQNFSLSISMQGVVGNDIYSLVRTTSLRSSFRRKLLGIANHHWISAEEPGDRATPRLHDEPTGGIREPNSYYLEDGTYLRINNINLSYVIPNSLAQKLNLNSARIYINATNPFLFSKTSGFNPDVTTPGNALTPGEDNNQYPLARSINLGLNIIF